MNRRHFFKAGVGSLAVLGASTAAAVTPPPKTGARILSETRTSEFIAGEWIKVHRVEIEVDFEPSLFCEILDSTSSRGRRRMVFPLYDLKKGEDQTERIGMCLKAYRSTCFATVLPGPNMPEPIGFFVTFRYEGRAYFGGAVTGYDMTSANIMMMAPAPALFG